MLIPLSPNVGRDGALAIKKHRKPHPLPAGTCPTPLESLDEPRLSAEDLEREIGDSETWDEASEDKDTATG